jgi:flagellar biosynthesis/type III secretory pathway M-ring protein FliF/YscJ
LRLDVGNAESTSIGISWLFTLYFVAFIVILLFLIKSARTKINQQNKVHHQQCNLSNAENQQMNLKNKKDSIRDIADFQSNCLWVFSGVLEDLRVSPQIIYLYSPVFDIIRAFLVALLVFL